MNTYRDYSKQDLANYLRSHGLSVTASRVELAYRILQNYHHLTSEEIANLIADEDLHVSRATVYNALNLFVEIGLLSRIRTGRNSFMYDVNVGDHHHAVDTESGEMIDFAFDARTEKRIRDLVCKELGDELGFEIDELSLVAYGRRAGNSANPPG